eukprot:4254511-Pyramimonas_sp.AAC.1
MHDGGGELSIVAPVAKIGRSSSLRFARLKTGTGRATEVITNNKDNKVTGWPRFNLFCHSSTIRTVQMALQFEGWRGLAKASERPAMHEWRRLAKAGEGWRRL